ncbi:MAG: tyrosine-type recombinase/integrase [Ignavibacteriaceae bacterium]
MGKFMKRKPNGQRTRERTLLLKCKNIAQAANIGGRAFLHKFRHTFATQLVKNNVPRRRLMALT